ncbi:MAG: hypothetical protein WD226_06560 [Planctomycetota bacterium]
MRYAVILALALSTGCRPQSKAPELEPLHGTGYEERRSPSQMRRSMIERARRPDLALSADALRRDDGPERGRIRPRGDAGGGGNEPLTDADFDGARAIFGTFGAPASFEGEGPSADGERLAALVVPWLVLERGLELEAALEEVGPLSGELETLVRAYVERHR